MGKVKRDIPVYSAVIKESASSLSLVNPKGGAPSLPSISSPSIAVSTAPVVDNSVSVIHPASVETMDVRELTPVGNSSHLDVPASSLPAASSCLDVLAGGDSGAIEQAASGISKKRKEGGTFTFNDPDASSVTPEDCAWFLRSFHLSSSFLPSLEGLAFSREYVEWASYEAHVFPFVFFFPCFFVCFLSRVFFRS